MVLLSIGFEYVENLEFVCMNDGPVAYENDLMICVDCFGLAFGPLLVLFCCSASSGKSLRSLLRLNRVIPCFRCMIY